MKNGEVKFALAKLCSELFGHAQGYPLVQMSPDGKHSYEQLYVYYWQFDPENGALHVYQDIMANHGGDQALDAKLQGRYGSWR